jgi:hypothetical protein
MARPRVELSKDRHARILKMWADGRSATAIAEDVGVARATLARILREAGIDVVSRKWGRRGPDSHKWSGGRVKHYGGYVAVYVPRDSQWAPMARKPRHHYGQSALYVAEHRLVMAQKLGRLLLPHETVHHINGKRDDNRVENLELRVGRHGNGTAMRCADCGSCNVLPVSLSSVN